MSAAQPFFLKTPPESDMPPGPAPGTVQQGLAVAESRASVSGRHALAA
jgi:hypothetical protein